MKITIALSTFVALCAVQPLVASASQVQSTMVPDGTYTVKVEKVDDSHHVTVQMDNGIETTLPAKSSVDFSNVKPNDTLMVSIIAGGVPVYRVK